MTWLCLFRVLALALTCKQASKLNKCPIYTGVLYFWMYDRMSSVYVYTVCVRCVVVRLRLSIDMHMREYRRWMSNTWVDGKIDRHCMLFRFSRDYYSCLSKLSKFKKQIYFHLKRDERFLFRAFHATYFRATSLTR